MTDTQREPKPGEWWEHKVHGAVQVTGFWDGFCYWMTGPESYGRSSPRLFVRFIAVADLTPPAPPAKKLRAWTFEEAPLGAIFREKGHHQLLVAVGCTAQWIEFFRNGMSATCSFDYLLAKFEHSTDSGRTWQPCGVEE